MARLKLMTVLLKVGNFNTDEGVLADEFCEPLVNQLPEPY